MFPVHISVPLCLFLLGNLGSPGSVVSAEVVPGSLISVHQGLARRLASRSNPLLAECEGGMVAAMLKVVGLEGLDLGGLLPSSIAASPVEEEGSLSSEPLLQYLTRGVPLEATSARGSAPTNSEISLVNHLVGQERLTVLRNLALLGVVSKTLPELTAKIHAEAPALLQAYAAHSLNTTDSVGHAAANEVQLSFSPRLDLTEIMKQISPLLMHLMSPFFGRFVNGILGEGQGVVLGEDKIGTAQNGLVIDQASLFNQFGRAVDLAKEVDPGRGAYEGNIRAGLGLIAAFLGCKDEEAFNPASCATQQVPLYDVATCTTEDNRVIDMKTVVADLDWMKDLRDPSSYEIPDTISTSALSADEKLLHFVLFRATSIAMGYASHTFPCSKDDLSPSQQLVPGWKLAHVFTYYAPGSLGLSTRPKKSLPLLLTLEPENPTEKNECDIIGIVRGTADPYEWVMNVDVTFVPAMNDAKYQIHRGMYRIASAIWPELNSFLEDRTEQCKKLSKPLRVLYAGHSLGAGLVNVLSFMTKYQFPDASVSTSCFAPLSTFNSPAMGFFRRNVNARNFVVNQDPIPGAPVTLEMSKVGQPRYGFGDTHDGKPLPYRYPPGRVEINFNEVAGPDMLNMTNSFGRASLSIDASKADSSVAEVSPDIQLVAKFTLDLTFPGTVQIAASHVCAYACWTSLHGCNKDPAKAWMCRDCPGLMPPIHQVIEIPIEL